MDYKLHTFEKIIDIAGLYTIFYFEHSKDFYFAGEQHDFWEMVYVDSGEITEVAENIGYVIHQGELIFHKPLEFHAMSANKKDPANVLVLTFESKSKALGFFENKFFTLNKNQKIILSNLVNEARNTFEDISTSNLALKPNISSPQLVINYLEQFLISLLQSPHSDSRFKRKSMDAKIRTENALVDAIDTYLHSKVYENITLSDICKQFNMGKSYISELFKDTTGKSIIDYYIDLKITEAKKLIRQGELNFTQISEKLGYNSIHHFSRIFKNKTNMSPSSYAKSVGV